MLTNATIIKAAMSSAAEVELGALYLNTKEAVYLRQILSKMGHPQPKMPIQTDYTTVEGVINNKIQPKRSKKIDMQFHWLRNQEAQGQFKIYWQLGGTNLSPPCQCQGRIFHNSQGSSRSKMHENEKTDQNLKQQKH
jgi:hypothetical protein